MLHPWDETHLSIYPSILQFNHSSISLSNHTYIHSNSPIQPLSIHPSSIHQTIHLSTTNPSSLHPSIHPSHIHPYNFNPLNNPSFILSPSLHFLLSIHKLLIHLPYFLSSVNPSIIHPSPNNPRIQHPSTYLPFLQPFFLSTTLPFIHLSNIDYVFTYVPRLCYVQ